MAGLSLVDYIVFAASLLICFAVGVYYLIIDRKQQSKDKASKQHQKEEIPLSDITQHGDRDKHHNNNKEQDKENHESRVSEYFLGSRRLAFFPTVCSLFASFFSSVGMLGIPADVYTVGTIPTLTGFMFIPASFVVAFIYLPIYFRNKFNSVFQYIEARFDSPMLRKFTALGTSGAYLAYAAVSTYVPCVAFRMATGIPEWVTIIVTGLVTLFYTAVGGLRAVVLVDTIQAGIMFFGVIFALVVGATHIGDLSEAWNFATEMKRTTFDDWSWEPWQSHAFWSMAIGNFFMFIVVHCNNQATLQRCCSLGNLNRAKAGILLMGPFFGLLTTILWLSALVAFVYYNRIVGCDPLASKKVPNLNMIMPFFMMEVINYPGFMGVYFACLFSAAISSMSTAYNTVASLIWEDWLKGILASKLSSKQKTLIFVKVLAAAMGVLVAALAVLARYVPGSAVKISISFSGIFTGAVHAVYFCGVFLPFITTASLYAGLFVSMPLALAIVLGQNIFQPYNYRWSPFVTDRCSNLTTLFNESNILRNMTSPTSIVYTTMQTPPQQLSAFWWGVFSMSYTYIPLFAMICCLLVAISMSLVTRYVIARYCPNAAWLKHPIQVNPAHLAFPSILGRFATINNNDRTKINNKDDE